MKRAAEAAYGLQGDVERIWLAWGPPPEIADFADLDGTLGGMGDNGLVSAELINGETVRLRYRPGGPQQTRRLEDLGSGVAFVAKERSQKLTGSLAIVWATVTILFVAI